MHAIQHGAFGCISLFSLTSNKNSRKTNVAAKKFTFGKSRENAQSPTLNEMRMNDDYDYDMIRPYIDDCNCKDVNNTIESLYSFTTEVAAFSHIKEHPNIVALLWWALSDCTAVILLEAAMSDLYDFVCSKETFLMQDTVLDFSRQIVDALCHVHSLNFIHGDLKLENILVFSENLVKLSDFGASCTADNARFDSGSLSYLPPEVFVKNTDKDPYKTDIWGLGICMFAMRTKRLPFTCSSTTDACFRRFLEFYKQGISLKDTFKFEKEDDLLSLILQSILSINHKKRPSSKHLLHMLSSRSTQT